MGNKLAYLFLHCAATPEGRDVRPEHILQMHMGPRSNADGSVTYLGRTYAKRADLPPDVIGGVPVARLNGNGWDRPGYRTFIDLQGNAHRLRPANDNDIVEPGEVTWGVGPQYNGISHHVCYAGGMDAAYKNPKDTRTPEQIHVMAEIIRWYIGIAPGIKIIGHNQVAGKACPSFSVPKFCRAIGVPEANIHTGDPDGYAAAYEGLPKTGGAR